MTTAILITQCLQRDFIAPIGPHESLPNTLHVGASEACRLVGDDPHNGPLAQVIHWARSQDPQNIEIIHLRDWHRLDDPAQQEHIGQFGAHCIANTAGAKLVIDEAAVELRDNEHFVNSITLNDFEGTDLTQLLQVIRSRPDAEPVRVGVIGVWTEAKVTFLLYELLTRCRISELATCSALTASGSRGQHFIALDQLRIILGVQVFDSIGEFVNWLAPAGTALIPPCVRPSKRPKVNLEKETDLSEADLDVLAYLYRDSSNVELESLSGGFSGASVFRVRARDSLGHLQAASVLKLGPRQLIASERVAFERIESILGNDAPRIRDFVDLNDRAGIMFAYAAMGNARVRTLKSLYESGAKQDRINNILQQVFGEILGRFQAGAKYEKLSLSDYYTFSADYADSVRKKVARLVGPAAANQKWLQFPGDYEVGNVAEFYANGLREFPSSPNESHYVSYVHGDLNTANILVDERDNVWLIDFLQAHRGHAMRDLAKLENDVLYVCTRIQGEQELAESIRITATLRCVKDLRAPLPEILEDVNHPHLLRAWQTVRTLRQLGAETCQEEREPLHLTWALLRYAVHTLSFDESNHWQKLWALAAAGGYADDLIRTARENRPLRVDWLPEPWIASIGARLGLTICPGRRDRGRQLDADIITLVDDNVTRLLSLMTTSELHAVGVEGLGRIATEHGIESRHELIRDQGAPSVQQMNEIATWMEDGLKTGRDTVVHCLGGLGRSGVVVACVLVRHGLGPDSAIQTVREIRGPRAVETTVQERFIHHYAAVCNHA